MRFLLDNWETLSWSFGILTGAVIIAILVRFFLFGIMRRLARRRPSLLKTSVVHHSERPARWILPLLALVVALPAAPLPSVMKSALRHFAGLGLIASIAWLIILVSEVLFDIGVARYRTDVADNLLARKVQTQLHMLHRVVSIVVLIVALAIMLMTFPEIRQIGTSLLASAGLAGLIVGMAMKSTLSSLIAGIQIALTQPIRIDDVVVVENEWGRIEEIESTYVVVRIWDLRRLVLPLSYFIEHPFQNWTRTGSDLLAYVLLWTDYTVPVDELRQELTRILKSTDKWKGQVNVLQVTDASEHSVQIRALMDARDSSQAWDLRCLVREKLIQFLQQRHPQSLPRYRGELHASAEISPLPGGFAGALPPGAHVA
jgi:small-conductance mechanosensitive channel